MRFIVIDMQSTLVARPSSGSSGRICAIAPRSYRKIRGTLPNSAASFKPIRC